MFSINPVSLVETLNVQIEDFMWVTGILWEPVQNGFKTLQAITDRWGFVSKQDLDLDNLNLKINNRRKLFIVCCHFQTQQALNAA